jgi:hypothetical protein
VQDRLLEAIRTELQLKREHPGWGAPKIRERGRGEDLAGRYDLGFFDDETCRIESAANPFAAKVSPMSPV